MIVEEWKSARALRPWHRAQMGVYFLLVEERMRVRPSQGFVVCGIQLPQRRDSARPWIRP